MKAILAENGISIRKMAIEAKIPETTLRGWVNGTRSLSSHYRDKVNVYLQIWEMYFKNGEAIYTLTSRIKCIVNFKNKQVYTYVNGEYKITDNVNDIDELHELLIGLQKL